MSNTATPRYEWLDDKGKKGWKLFFHFAENEYFTNKVPPRRRTPTGRHTWMQRQHFWYLQNRQSNYIGVKRPPFHRQGRLTSYIAYIRAFDTYVTALPFL